MKTKGTTNQVQAISRCNNITPCSKSKPYAMGSSDHLMMTPKLLLTLTNTQSLDPVALCYFSPEPSPSGSALGLAD